MSERNPVYYDEAQVNRWLAWLAHTMQRHGQTVFLIETLQPSWLQTRGEVRTFSVVTRMMWGVWVTVTGGLLLTLASNLLYWWSTASGQGLLQELAQGPVHGLPVALLVGLFAGALDSRNHQYRSSLHAEPRKSASLRNVTIKILWVGIFSSLLFGVLFGLRDGVTFGLSLGLASGILVGLVSGIGQGVLYGICFTLIYATRSVLRSPSAAIITVEIISWSRIKALRIGKRGVLIGLIAGLGLGLVYNLQPWLSLGHMGGEAVLSTLVSGLHIALICGLVGAVVGAAVGGIEPVMRELKTKPNQGIRLSLSNAVLMGAISGLLMGLVMAGISSMSIQDTGLAFLIGLIFGLLAAIALGGWFGGIDVAEHAILRLIFARKGYAPLNYARFLDYAADELNFLQKVGGGYIFIHRYLLEYFAGMYEAPAPADKPSTADSAREPGTPVTLAE